ncbi:FMN-dependent NADH-azoreductase [Mycoplasma crocodyli]|uniref:FMN-dependent NADH-azo-oxidoreductase n=1 Tax=Mycoplasma crocodyli (strain ATCC 51981 / MP145) TaxID=512564 RepID=D5E5S1_MYCCM|nr:FMN-dependent NADH-azoreductase [Mycoplasma crocodyli]ADE19767.1 FMN-dependent NADH-azo-oxidoreductase [Mycoplasma crocodyli MP145]
MSKTLILYGELFDQEKSISHLATKEFLEKYKLQNKTEEIEEINLNETELSSVFLTNQNFATYYKEVKSDFWIEKLKNVDKVVISVPMINFGPSVIVKNFIDAIAVANKTFSYKYSKKGDAIGLLDNIKKVLIVGSQGAPADWYLWGSHTLWLEGTWKFFGAKNVETLLLSGVKTPVFSNMTPKEIVGKFDKEIESSAKKF